MCNGFISSTLSPFLVLSVRLARPSVASEHAGDSLGNLGPVANDGRAQKDQSGSWFQKLETAQSKMVCGVTEKDAVLLGRGVNGCSR